MSYRDDFMNNYTPGAINDSSVHWNKKGLSEKSFSVAISYSISKDIDITSTDYDYNDKLNCP